MEFFEPNFLSDSTVAPNLESICCLLLWKVSFIYAIKRQVPNHILKTMIDFGARCIFDQTLLINGSDFLILGELNSPLNKGEAQAIWLTCPLENDRNLHHYFDNHVCLSSFRLSQKNSPNQKMLLIKVVTYASVMTKMHLGSTPPPSAGGTQRSLGDHPKSWSNKPDSS